jgi:hypothetical protein
MPSAGAWHVARRSKGWHSNGLRGRDRAHAVSGKAILRFEFPKDSGYVSLATEFPVELAAKTKGQ